MEFRYIARDITGAKRHGIIEAPTEIAALKALRERGLITSQLRPQGVQLTSKWFARSVSLRERMLFTQELALMIRSGIPLARALSDLEDQTTSRTLRDVLRKLSIDVRGGTAFSTALRKHPEIFPPLMTAMIRSGEASGKLVEVLERLAEQMEKDANLRSKIISALIYPFVLVVGIVGVMTLVTLFVVPQLKKIFADVGTELPWITRALLATTDFVRAYGAYVGLAFVLAIITTIIIFRLPGPASWFDKWKLRVPLFGLLSQKIAIARFATTGKTLLAAGVPLVEALRISQEVIGNRYYQAEVARIARAAESGRSLAETIRAGRVLPPMVSHLVAVGEESGSLDKTFATIATFYDREVEATTRNLTTLLEPALMILMGITIGFLVAAILMPIYRLVQAL